MTTTEAPTSSYRRSHTCGELRPDHAGQTVTLAGWANAARDHGSGLYFIDIRDRYGVTQITVEKGEVSEDILELASRIRSEDCIAVTGTVRVREGKPNKNIATGEIELVASTLSLLNKTANPPLQPSDPETPSEELRLEHRYLDLRRTPMQKTMETRHRVTKTARDYFDEHGFLEIETPYLCRSTPEGARDFLVPSRLTPGAFYALPQSPQLFKQILMVSGLDRYIQFPKCFRDEDLRADRQPEFTQIDLEMSFVTADDVIEMMEGFVRTLWKRVLDVDVATIPRMTYADAMERFGIDRPDLRYGLELVDVSDLAAKTDFKVFTGALEKDRGCVKAIRVPGGAAKLTRKVTDGYSEFVKTFGAGGIPTTKVAAGGNLDAGVAKFLEPVASELVERMGAEEGDTILFGADTWSVAVRALGELRQRVARDMEMIDDDAFAFVWVVDFPMFEHDEETDRFYAMHHPFTAPKPDQADAFLATNPADVNAIEAIVSAGYDIVCNGYEIGGGSIRIHDGEVQSKVFELLGIGDVEANAKFSFLMDALKFGAPPHGGIAFGLDRLVMLLTGTTNIRDVIAFPKTHTGTDMMCKAPSGVDAEQLTELFITSTAETGES